MSETAPKIELKGIKYTAWASEETHCYQATLYVDGVKWGIVSNDGHGGGDRFDGLGGRGWSDIAELNKRIAATIPPYTYEDRSLPYDLELICADLVNDWLARRDFTKLMRTKVLFTKPGEVGIWQVPVVKGATHAMTLDVMHRKHPAYTYLSDLPEAEAWELYRAATKA